MTGTSIWERLELFLANALHLHCNGSICVTDIKPSMWGWALTQNVEKLRRIRQSEMENRSGHIIRKKSFGSEQENVRSPLPPSLVKPSNLPITRIAPSDVISVDAKIKPLKIEGSIDLQKLTFNRKRRVEGMSQTPQMFTWTGDKPQQTDCLALVSSESKNIQLTILQKSMPHIYSCSTLPCFHLLPPSLGMFAQGKEVQRQKSVVNVSIWQEWV